jgi:hypothetical protein
MMKKRVPPGYQINLPPLSTRPENRTTVEVDTHTSAPSCTTALLGLAPARSARASAANNRESISTYKDDEPVLPTVI